MKRTLFKYLLVLIVLAVNFFVYRQSLIESFQSWRGKNLVAEVKRGKLWGNFDQLRSEAIEYWGWSAKDKIDLSLEPGNQGLATYQFTKPESARVTILQLGLGKPNGSKNKVSVSTDNANWTTVKENQLLHLVPLDLTPLVAETNQFWVKIEASNDSSSETGVFLYDFYLMFYDHDFKLPNLPLMLATIIIPLLIIFRPNKKLAIKLLLLLAVFELSLYLAGNHLYKNRFHSFDSDVICLTQAVSKIQSLEFKQALVENYCGNKESLNPLFIVSSWKVFGWGSEIGLRFWSFIFHLLTVVLVFDYGRKIGSFVTGLVAALFVGTHQYLVELSIRGLRDSAFTFIVLLFVYLLWETDWKKWRYRIGLFLAGAFSIYLRLHSLIQLILVTGFMAVDQKQLTKGLLIGVMLVATAMPIIRHNLSVYGEWNYSEATHLRWNANVEFAGQVGFPSQEAVALNPFQGPKISTVDYFFKLHSLADLTGSTLVGIKKIFDDLYFRYLPQLWYVFIAGSILIFRNKRLRYIFILVFLLEIPHFFLVAKNLVEFRSMTQSLPFIGLTIGYIIDRLWTRLTRF